MGSTAREEDLGAYLATYRVRHEATPGGGPALLPLAQERRLADEFQTTTHQVELAALGAHVMPERYLRNLGTAGWDGQLRLLRSTVAVVGAGGLGGWIIEGLARMGVGRLILIDGDIFQDNNLNRQLGCTEETLGQAKVVCLADRLAHVNSAVTVVPHKVWLDEHNAADLLAGAEVVVDALDRLPTRLLLQKVANGLKVPLVHGAIGGYTGQVMTILPGDPGLRALYGDRDLPEQGVEVALGNPAATPMMISAWQIQEVIKILLDQGDLLRHRLLLMDAEAGDVTEVSLG